MFDSAVQFVMLEASPLSIFCDPARAITLHVVLIAMRRQLPRGTLANFKLSLTGEEVVTKECFVSVCWRLIPYFLNNWEKQWGAECSSMMFELPHFAFELLVILPIVQVSLDMQCLPILYVIPLHDSLNALMTLSASHTLTQPA